MGFRWVKLYIINEEYMNYFTCSDTQQGKRGVHLPNERDTARMIDYLSLPTCRRDQDLMLINLLHIKKVTHTHKCINCKTFKLAA